MKDRKSMKKKYIKNFISFSFFVVKEKDGDNERS